MMSSMKLLLGLFLITSASYANADGFICSSEEEGLKVQVYNKLHAGEGTRNPSVMVISDETREEGNRTLATFRADDGELHSDGARFYAHVADAELDPSRREAQAILLGLVVGELREVSLVVDFFYDEPVEHGTRLDGVLELVKFNGDMLWLEMDCKRYLKQRRLSF